MIEHDRSDTPTKAGQRLTHILREPLQGLFPRRFGRSGVFGPARTLHHDEFGPVVLILSIGGRTREEDKDVPARYCRTP
jgi:hypothetical protein